MRKMEEEGGKGREYERRKEWREWENQRWALRV